MKQFLGSDENHFGFVIVELEFVVCHPSLDIGDTELCRANDTGQRRNIIRFVQLVVIGVTVMGEGVVSYDFRNRLRVK